MFFQIAHITHLKSLGESKTKECKVCIGQY